MATMYASPLPRGAFGIVEGPGSHAVRLLAVAWLIGASYAMIGHRSPGPKWLAWTRAAVTHVVLGLVSLWVIEFGTWVAIILIHSNFQTEFPVHPAVFLALLLLTAAHFVAAIMFMSYDVRRPTADQSPTGTCPTCGYDMTGCPNDTCPECGVTREPPARATNESDER